MGRRGQSQGAGPLQSLVRCNQGEYDYFFNFTGSTAFFAVEQWLSGGVDGGRTSYGGGARCDQSFGRYSALHDAVCVGEGLQGNSRHTGADWLSPGRNVG